MLPDAGSKFDDALAMLERNDFAGARDAYREGCLLESPNLAVLGNLEIAEEQEQIAFRRTLMELHVGSLSAKMGYAHALLRNRRPHQAVDVCTQALGNVAADMKTAMPIRLLRMRAAFAAAMYDVAMDDVLAIWRAAEVVPAARAFRRGILKQIAALQDTGAIDALRALVDELPGETVIASFLQGKVNELERFEAALESFDDPLDETVDVANLSRSQPSLRGTAAPESAWNATMSHRLYKPIDVWRRVGSTRLVRYRCFEVLPDGGFCVQSADFFDVPLNEKAAAQLERQWLELFGEEAPESRSGVHSSLQAAVEAHDRSFDDRS